MADKDVATRAPESDAADMDNVPLQDTPATTDTETSSVKDDQKPQSGGDEAATTATSTTTTTETQPTTTTTAQSSSINDHCNSDRPLPTNTNPAAGELTTLNGIECYITKPKDYPSNPSKLLLLLTGGTGVKSPNNQLQADTFASNGYVVVMPDQFSNDPAPNSTMTEEEAAEAKRSIQDEKTSLLDRIKLGAAETAKSFLIDMWLARHTPEKVLPILDKVIAGAKEAYADALANGGGLYGIGYCFGAKYIMILSGSKHQPAASKGSEPAQTPADTSSSTTPQESQTTTKSTPKPQIKAGAIAHGTLITHEDIQDISSPISMICIKGDSLFPDDIREQGRASLELNSVEHEIHIFDDVPHGFAVAGNYKDKQIMGRQAQAFDIMAGWLEAHS